MQFTFTVSEKEVQDKWAKQTTPDRWIEMYQKLSDSYAHWDVDVKVAEFIINHIKEYIKEYMPEDLPKVLQPLLVEELKNNIIENNLENKDITLEDVADEAELYAIELLRDYDFINYEDAVNIICNSIEFGRESVDTVSKGLEEYTTAELLAEISNRV